MPSAVQDREPRESEPRGNKRARGDLELQEQSAQL